MQKNTEEIRKLLEPKEQKIEPQKTENVLYNFMVKSFDYSKSAIFQQIIEEAIEKVEQEEIAKQELDRNDGIKDTTKSILKTASNS